VEAVFTFVDAATKLGADLRADRRGVGKLAAGIAAATPLNGVEVEAFVAPAVAVVVDFVADLNAPVGLSAGVFAAIVVEHVAVSPARQALVDQASARLARVESHPTERALAPAEPAVLWICVEVHTQTRINGAAFTTL
jgi:hypothetical protein